MTSQGDGVTEDHPSPTDSDEEWVIEDLTQRAVWTTETTDCVHCGSTVDLETVHYYATCRPVRSTTTQTRDLVFCSRGCFDEWS